MNSRERVRRTLGFETPDRTPKDLGGMGSTSISAFAYANLVKSLGLSSRTPKIQDVWQMLALPELDVLDALDCDVIYADKEGNTNAFSQPKIWKSYDFNKRLPSLVAKTEEFTTLSDGTIIRNIGKPSEMTMPPSSVFFDNAHGGQPLDISVDPELEDLDLLETNLKKGLLEKPQIEEMTAFCRQVRKSTDRAVFYSGPRAGLGYRGGMANWSMIVLMYPEHAHAVHGLITKYAVENYSRIMPHIKDSVDILMICGDDQGTQQSTILPPTAYKEVFSPYYRQINTALADLAPHVFRFLHSCGAIYEIIDDIIDSGFQILNPIQWTAGEPSLQDWKDKCRNRIALWGGGVDTQSMMTHGTLEQISAQVRNITTCLKEDNGYVFCAIHNLLAEVSGEKIKTIYNNVQ